MASPTGPARTAPRVAVRLLTEDDVPALTALLRRSREHLAPWEPLRPDAFFTEAHQREAAQALLERHRAGTHVPLVVTDDDEPVGRVTVNDVVRGAFQSASLGYWVGAGHTGRGVATAAVAATVRLASSAPRGRTCTRSSGPGAPHRAGGAPRREDVRRGRPHRCGCTTWSTLHTPEEDPP